MVTRWWHSIRPAYWVTNVMRTSRLLVWLLFDFPDTVALVVVPRGGVAMVRGTRGGVSWPL